MDNQHLAISKILVCIGALLCLYFVYPKAKDCYTLVQDCKKQVEKTVDIQAQITELKREQDKQEQSEKSSTKPVYKNEIAVNDRMSSFGVMFEDVIQSAKYNGLKLRSIEYNETPDDDIIQQKMSGEYNVCAVKMQLIGSYVQFRSYFQDIYNYPYVINLDKVSIKPYEKDKKVLIADVTVVLYSSKTDAEISEAKRQEAAASAVEDADRKDTTETGAQVAAPQG